MTKYARFSINSYARINPDFQINVVHYTPILLEKLYFEKNITNEIDYLVFNLLKSLINNTKYQRLILRQIKFFLQFGVIPFIQLFCDILRLELINTYGGIYVDCDTYPIKSFDNTILSYNNFCVYDKIKTFHEINNYFMGSDKSIFIENYFDSHISELTQTNNFMIKSNISKPIEFLIRRIKFFNCKLTDSDFKHCQSDNYIEHYSDFSWGRKKVDFTKFDSIFNMRVI